jgi:hypothetical protein
MHLQTVALGDPLPMQPTRLLEAREGPSRSRRRSAWAELAFGSSIASPFAGRAKMRVGNAQKYWQYVLCPDNLIRSNQSVDRQETDQIKLGTSASDLGDVRQFRFQLYHLGMKHCRWQRDVAALTM